MTNHCTQQQCQALKEIGFDKAVRAYYDKRNKLCFYVEGTTNIIIGQLFGTCVAPTRSEVLQWARESHNIDAWVEPYMFNEIKVYFYCFEVDNVHESSVMDYPTYNQAESALVDKIIEILKEQKA